MVDPSTTNVRLSERTHNAARRHGRRAARDTLHGYLFLVPFFFFYLIFLVYPAIQGFWISLHQWDLLGTNTRFVGLANYQRLVRDGVFWNSLGHTLYFVLLSGPTLLALGLGLALLINRPYRGMGVFRMLFYLPAVLSVSVITTIWLKIYDPNYGLLANLWQGLGLGQLPYVLQHVQLAMPAVALTTVWWSVGTNMVLFLAGLQDIPPQLYEAAKLDGANRWAAFRHITLPALRRTMTFATIIQVIASIQVFGQVYNLTQGGPIGKTRTLVMYIYETSFRDYQLGYGSALAYALFLIMFVLSLIQLRFFTLSDERSAR